MIRAADPVERSGYVKRDGANSSMQGVNLRVQHENTMRCDKPSVTNLVNRTEVPGVDQQKQLQHSQSEISRVSECDEPRVVRSSPQDRQGHSRDHVEEGCERTENKT